MRIKKYVVQDMQEAFRTIKEDMGRDAVIISSNKIRKKGISGLLGAKMLEVTAASETGDTGRKVVPLAAAALPALRPPDEDGNRIEKELGDLKSMVGKLLKSNDTTGSPVEKWRELLESRELDMAIIDELMGSCIEDIGEESLNNALVWEVIKGKLTQFFQENTAKPSQNRIFAFIGPTGVGKTTTLAKLAAYYVFSLGKTVSMITIDTYRIGAVEQLRTYGNIMGVDVEVVITPEQLYEAVQRNCDKDFIFIDTTGRSPSDSMRIFEVRTFLDVIKPLEVFLVLSLTTKRHDLDRIASEYRVLDYTGLIFTKMDETTSFGSILNLVYNYKIPVAYLTNGQGVPEDILVADPLKLSELILGEVI